MRILDFIVSKQKIECDPRCDFSGIAPGSKGYLHARFKFSADWRGYKCVAVFSCRGKEYPAPIKNGMCAIPDGALIGSTVSVMVIGRLDGNEVPTNTTSFQQGGR